MMNSLYLVIYMFSNIYEIKTSEKEALNLKESEKEHMGGFGRRKGKGEMLKL